MHIQIVLHLSSRENCPWQVPWAPFALCSGPGNLFGLFLQHISEVTPAPRDGSRCEVFAAVSPQHPGNSPDSQPAMFSLQGMVLIRLSVSRGNKIIFSSHLSLYFLQLSAGNGLGYLLLSVISFGTPLFLFYAWPNASVSQFQRIINLFPLNSKVFAFAIELSSRWYSPWAAAWACSPAGLSLGISPSE